MDGPRDEQETAVCAVVVNWNGASDTITCFESLLALGGNEFHLVVCDNGSTDDSVARLQVHLRARLADWRDPDGRGLSFERPAAGHGLQSVHVLCLQRNLGYAGGLNAGIVWALERWAPRGFWLLNNDVEARAGALDALVAAVASVPNAGICGSVLMDWDRMEVVQAVAGVYRRWLGVGWHTLDLSSDAPGVKLDVDYPVGASMFVTRRYLDQVGLLEPSYFLYYEEMDWAERGRRQGYRAIIALGSRLRHKEGSSTGSRGGVRFKSLLSERCGVINRLRITWKFWPYFFPVVWLSLALVVVDRLIHGELARAQLVLQLMFSPGRWRPVVQCDGFAMDLPSRPLDRNGNGS